MKFPVAAIDQFYASFPMRVSGSGSSGGDDADSLIALLEQIGPAVLMPHSAAGPDHFAVAQQREDLVAGMVVVEPSGCPGVDPLPTPGSIPFAALYADISNRSAQSGRKAACQSTVDGVNANGGVGVMIDLTLPPYSLSNNHLMMQEVDSATIAGHVSFLDANVPSGTPPTPPTQDLRLAQANRFFVGRALTSGERAGQSLVHVLEP